MVLGLERWPAVVGIDVVVLNRVEWWHEDRFRAFEVHADVYRTEEGRGFPSSHGLWARILRQSRGYALWGCRQRS